MQTLKRRNKYLAFTLILSVFTLIFATILPATILKYSQNDNTFAKIDENIAYASSMQDYVHIGGNPIGISIRTKGLIVVGESSVVTEKGEVFPTKNLGIDKGDILTHINDEEVSSIYQLKEHLKKNESLKVNFLRGNKTFLVDIKPQYDVSNKQNRIGLLLKEDIGGIGTVTFVTQNDKFAALGHHIIDSDSGLHEELNSGHIYNTSITDVIKGERGKAGGLVGDVNRLSNDIGDIKINSNIGLYGNYDGENLGDLYRIAKKGEAKIGKAQVFTTIDGDTPKFYDIEIVKVISQSSASEKGMVISVSDKELLAKTGGIVQGMSGSPIIQNGILIGAVTHVFIQDSTRGYAIHSRFMYDMANSVKNDNLTISNEEFSNYNDNLQVA